MPFMKNSSISGIILAGGRSSRMGTDKAFIQIGSKTLIEKMFDLIKKYCVEILISANDNTGYSFPGQRIIPDERHGLGPIGGIYSCLKQSRTENNLVIAVDMPFINDGLIQFLLANTGNAELVVPATGKGKIEPLCAVYRKSVAAYLEKMIAENDLKVQNLMNYCRSHKLHITREQEFYNDRLFFNVNTQADFNKLTR